jgi:PAS domain S-box-containing protein
VTSEPSVKTMPPQAESCDAQQLTDIITASRNKLKAVFDAISDPVCSFTTDFKVESLNMALAELANRHPRELVGMTGQELMRAMGVAPGLQFQLEEAFAEVVRGGKPMWRLTQADTPGGTRFFEMTATPALDAAGEVTLLIVQVRDVTVFKRMEQTVREYSQSLELMVAERTRDLTEAQEQLKGEKERLALANRELLRLDKLRQDLTSMVVHDMKGPLAEVMGNLDLMGYDPLTETQREALDLALMGADDLLRMIMNLLDISRLEEGRLVLRYAPVDFTELSERLLSKFRTVTRLKNLSVQASVEEAFTLDADPELIYRLLQNLLTNAINHTPEGGRVEIAAEAGAEGGVVLRLEDNGEGIPERARSLIFKKFTQAHTTSGPRTSTGLGLTFCKMVAEAHGGRIWFDSQEGRGTTFYVWLPGKQPE